MFILMFISLLFARKFRRKMFASLTIIAIGLISFLSVGFPSFFAYSKSFYHNPIILLKVENPLPLSLPFYTNIIIHCGDFGCSPNYEIYFLSVKLSALGTYPTLGGFILGYTFFLLLNLVGAIFGYWISKSKFLEKYFARRKPKTS